MLTDIPVVHLLFNGSLVANVSRIPAMAPTDISCNISDVGEQLNLTLTIMTEMVSMVLGTVTDEAIYVSSNGEVSKKGHIFKFQSLQSTVTCVSSSNSNILRTEKSSRVVIFGTLPQFILFSNMKGTFAIIRHSSAY